MHVPHACDAQILPEAVASLAQPIPQETCWALARVRVKCLDAFGTSALIWHAQFKKCALRMRCQVYAQTDVFGKGCCRLP
jgi:hypothetical protein